MEKLTFSFSDRETKYGTVYRTVKTIITSNKWFLSIFISIPGAKRSSLQFSIVTFAIACDRNEVTIHQKHKTQNLNMDTANIIRKLPFCFSALKSSIQFRAVRLGYTIHFCGVVMRQGDTHTFIAFYIMSFINWTTIFIVQIIIYFHLVSVLLHRCCITLISLSTRSFTDVGNST